MSSEYNWSDIFFKAVHLNASHGSTGSLDGCDTEGDPSEAEPSSDDGCESKLEDSSRECNKAPLIDLVCCSVLAWRDGLDAIRRGVFGDALKGVGENAAEELGVPGDAFDISEEESFFMQC